MLHARQLDHFTLTREIGRGGMGTVYSAVDTSLDRPVAIKLLNKESASDPEFVASFLQEARHAAAVSHPHIVQVHFVGQAQGEVYVVMELLEGRTLANIIQSAGAISEEDALEITIGVAEALQAAYDRNAMIHGDIKPANIFVTNEWGAKVLDFGLARLANVEHARPGEIWGSPYYISPERVRGRTEDFRSDVYSLGATLFHALTGRPPFDAPTAEELSIKRLNAKAPLVREIKPTVTVETEQVVAKLLNRSALMRVRDYAQLLEWLQQAKSAAIAQRLGIQILTNGTFPGTRPSFNRVEDRAPKRLWSRITRFLGQLTAMALGLLILTGIACPHGKFLASIVTSDRQHVLSNPVASIMAN